MIHYLAKKQYTIVDLLGQLGIAWLITSEHNWWYVLMAIPLGFLTAFIDSVERTVNGRKK